MSISTMRKAEMARVVAIEHALAAKQSRRKSAVGMRSARMHQWALPVHGAIRLRKAYLDKRRILTDDWSPCPAWGLDLSLPNDARHFNIARS